MSTPGGGHGGTILKHMIYFSLLVFAILPSLIWLLYYLKKDIRSEPKHLIVYVFLTGALFAVVGYFFQLTMGRILPPFAENISFFAALYLPFYKFVIIAFSEEFLKYLAFFFTIRDHPELDEPLDFVIYMITAALGFAALENIIYLSSAPDIMEMARFSAVRFVSGTFLHALASGILGVFLAYSCKLNKKYLVIYGLIFVSGLHGIYNLLAQRITETSGILFVFTFLFVCAIVLSVFIEKLKKMKSTCSIK